MRLIEKLSVDLDLVGGFLPIHESTRPERKRIVKREKLSTGNRFNRLVA